MVRARLGVEVSLHSVGMHADRCGDGACWLSVKVRLYSVGVHADRCGDGVCLAWCVLRFGGWLVVCLRFGGAGIEGGWLKERSEVGWRCTARVGFNAVWASGLGPALEQQKKAWSLQSMEGKCMKLSDDEREGYFGKDMNGVDLNKSVEEEDDGSFDAGKENENQQSKF
ncbi:hypothetical protein NE237_028368 [Protea cynaroides]|uniref:Uncharacterized protein n=1 Tax=Protea cynaroides TaxID=273540 RepID=A0A9Q0GR15_9MAGN|nr:hypothetical protein NE237_028368 [Protea cynaroides]